MAYLTSIERSCATCGKPAKVELRNRFNEPMNVYCKPCGKRAEERQAAHERQRDAESR